MSKVPHMESIGETAFEVIGIYTVHQYKTTLCSELGQKLGSKNKNKNYYKETIKLS